MLKLPFWGLPYEQNDLHDADPCWSAVSSCFQLSWVVQVLWKEYTSHWWSTSAHRWQLASPVRQIAARGWDQRWRHWWIRLALQPEAPGVENPKLSIVILYLFWKVRKFTSRVTSFWSINPFLDKVLEGCCCCDKIWQDRSTQQHRWNISKCHVDICLWRTQQLSSSYCKNAIHTYPWQHDNMTTAVLLRSHSQKHIMICGPTQLQQEGFRCSKFRAQLKRNWCAYTAIGEMEASYPEQIRIAAPLGRGVKKHEETQNCWMWNVRKFWRDPFPLDIQWISNGIDLVGLPHFTTPSSMAPVVACPWPLASFAVCSATSNFTASFRSSWAETTNGCLQHQRDQPGHPDSPNHWMNRICAYQNPNQPHSIPIF